MASLYTKVILYLKDNSKTWDAEKNNIRLVNNGSGDIILKHGHIWIFLN